MNNHIYSKLSVFYFGYYAIIGTFMPFWNLYLEQQGLNYHQIGWLASIAVITRFFAPFIWGRIADKTAKRMLLVRIACAVECFIWFMIFLLPTTLHNIALLMFIFSFFQNAILAQFESITLFYLDKRKNELYAKIRKWGSIGFIAGVTIVGVILDYISIQILPVLLLGISFFVFIWSFQIAEPQQAPMAQKQLISMFPTLKHTAVWGFFTIQFILLFSHAPFYSFYSNYLHDLHYTKMQIGFLWSLGVIAEIIMFATSTYFFKHLNLQQLLKLCILLTAIRWLGVGYFAHHFSIQIIAQCIHAFSFGLFHLIAMQMISHYFSAEQQGRAQALYSTIWGFAVAGGSILIGQFWQNIGGQIIFMLVGLICLFALGFIPLIPKTLKNA